ncbi:hypothetical protein Tco_0736966 [Tanacetum coccineum]
MLTKPQFFYDHTTKQALGFQNPFYLKKAQQLEPKLYVGDIIEKTNPIVISDSEETLILAEESRSKMLLKQQDPMMLEKNVNTTPVDYAVLNQLSQDFKTRFVSQIELSAEQDFWSKNFVNSLEPTLSSRPTKVEVPKKLPKSQEKDTVIKKLKERIKVLSRIKNEDKIKQELEEIETINIELDHRVTKLIAKNEHLKQTYKQLYDSSKPTHVNDGKILVFSGLQIFQNPRGIFINQSKYALESLKKYGFDSCDPVDTPMVEKSKLDEDKEGKAVDPSHYRGMIGTLLYLIASRPDLQFAICMCARYQARPTEKHLHAVKRIFRYLRGTVNRGLWYPMDSSIALTTFADADHNGCQDTRRSISGSMQFLGDRLVSWSPKRSKHIDIRFHFIKEHVENGVIELYFVNTEYQLADIFTKPLCKERIEFLINKLGMWSFTLETLKQLADEVDE